MLVLASLPDILAGVVLHLKLNLVHFDAVHFARFGTTRSYGEVQWLLALV